MGITSSLEDEPWRDSCRKGGKSRDFPPFVYTPPHPSQEPVSEAVTGRWKGERSMVTDLSIKNLVGRTERDPWNAILGSRPEKYRISEVGLTLIEAVDFALFRRNLREAITSGVILEKWAGHDLHFDCKAAAVMASVYSVCGLRLEAEKMLVKAKRHGAPDSNCKEDCKAQYFKRNGTFLMYENRYRDACLLYGRSADLFLDLGEGKEAGKSLLNRGVALAAMKRFDDALEDENRALDLLGEEFSFHIIAAAVNIAAIFMELEQVDLALSQVSHVQDMLKGSDNLERPRLILRWIRALLLVLQGDLKNAGEMIDRVEVRMKRLDMKFEHRVLLADRARIARQPSIIKRIAKKAYDMEDIPSVRKIIETVMREPTRENILAWRSSLGSYIPPFPVTV